MIDETVSALRRGNVVLLPADTVYGLCANPYRDDAARRLYRLKGRPETSPTAILASDVDMLFECVPELRGRSGVIARALLPGPYTLIFPNPARRFRWLTGTRPETIGVRVPELRGEARAVLEQVGAVAATSANLTGGPDARRVADVPIQIRDGCAAIIDGGELPGTPSTVLDLTSPNPEVVREGAVPAGEAIARALEAVG